MKQIFATIGRIGRVDLYPLENGKELLKFSLAVDDSYKDKNGEIQEGVVWFQCVCWNPSDYKKTIEKGDEIHITGKFKNRNYEDKNGTKHYEMEVSVFTLKKFINGLPKQVNDEFESDEKQDDLPF